MRTETTVETAVETTETTKNARKTWHDLSNELKASCIDRIIRPTDLKNICLVSKELHDIAVRFLYRNVAFDLGGPNDTKLSAFLNPNNKGLKHIRQIRLYLANVRDRCNQEQHAHFATRMLLEFLPENILEEFRCGFAETWCPWRPFSTDNLILLYKKQKRMKWLEVMDLDRDVLPELKKNPLVQKGLFDGARKLALYPENRETLNMCHMFIEKTTEVLEELIIHANFDTPDSRDPRDPTSNGSTIDNRELNDSATAPGLLTTTMFSHMLPFEKCTPFKKLTSLRLHRINLRHCADTWCTFVDFTQMQHLRLYQCTGVDSLMDQLSKSRNLPKQLKIFELQHRDNADNEALIALDGFLCLVSGLRDLIVDLECVKALPAAAGVARHGKTLELLNVHCSNDSNPPDPDTEELIWDTEEFEKICKACTKLEQLSCAWPSTSLIRSPSDEWKAYESAASSLREMVTLHISSWPSNKPSTQPLPRQVYEVLLQSLAQRTFEQAASTKSSVPDQPSGSSAANAAPSGDATTSTETSAEAPPLKPSKLRLLAFGISDKIYEREDSKDQVIYIRSTSKDAEGKDKIHAAPIGWCVRQYIEPRSDVLDFVLHRASRPPCQEESRFGIRDEDEWDE